VRKADVVLTVSGAVKHELETEMGARNVVVTPNGIDARFSPGEGTRTHFLYVGNDKPHKNVEALLAAFERVRRDDGAATLVLAGGAFERFRSRAGVIVRGFVPDDELVTLYRTALALVMPSREEGFGLPAAEAMACGTPVITSMAAALVEITGDAALHVDARSSDAIADAMQRVAGDAALRDSLAARGIERARSFTWKRCAETTAEAFRRVV
jgi:glycosyltransferase involved in cell wall biosynthesis